MAEQFSSDPARAQRIQGLLREIDTALKAGDVARAWVAAGAAHGEGYEHPGVLNLLAYERMGREAHGEALALASRAHELAPGDANILNTLGLCHRRSGDWREAIIAFNKAIAIPPPFAAAHFNKGTLLEDMGQFDLARAEYERAVEIKPAYAEAWGKLAHLAVQRGDTGEARAAAERALSHNPRQVSATIALAMAEIADGAYEAARARLAPLAGPDEKSAVNRSIALSLTGDAFDAAGDYDAAFAAYRAAKSELRREFAAAMNAAGADSPPAIVARFTEYFRDAPVEVWRADPQRAARLPPAPAGHVFLVGFPRSGTTLLEQILASHPEIVTMEERDALLHTIPGFEAGTDDLDRIAAMGPEEIAENRERYWQTVRDFGFEPDRKVFIDKMPLNSIILPLAARLFPEAKVLFAVRDPRDVILSCFRRRFGMTPQMYQFTALETAAEFYDGVMRLSRIHGERLGFPTHRLRHEDIVADFEGEARKLCGFLGVGWSDEMRDFAARARKRNIATPSAPQVARGLDAQTVGHWRHYAAHLEPVMTLLAPWAAYYGYPAE